jgi:hypothetical protein
VFLNLKIKLSQSTFCRFVYSSRSQLSIILCKTGCFPKKQPNFKKKIDEPLSLFSAFVPSGGVKIFPLSGVRIQVQKVQAAESFNRDRSAQEFL